MRLQHIVESILEEALDDSIMAGFKDDAMVDNDNLMSAELCVVWSSAADYNC
jgi:hypothetical protein